MDKQLAQHRTQEQGSRIAAAAHLNYEFAMYRLESDLAHLDHQVEQLNGVVIEQGKLLDPAQKGNSAAVQLHADAGAGTYQVQSAEDAALPMRDAEKRGFITGSVRKVNRALLRRPGGWILTK
jgi:hypothetical protein